MRSPIETKVALPALIMGPTIIIVPALYTLAKAYGFSPTADQNMAIIGLGIALQYVAHVYLGYRAPHTPRPDLPDHDDPDPDDMGMEGQALKRSRKRINVQRDEPVVLHRQPPGDIA